MLTQTKRLPVKRTNNNVYSVKKTLKNFSLKFHTKKISIDII
jgi:hypothetical protein